MSSTVKTSSFQLIGYDEGGLREGPKGDLRLVCNTQSGEKIAIFGSKQARGNIDAVINAGMPCVINCETRPPANWAIDRFDHTHWVPEGLELHIIAPANKVIEGQGMSIYSPLCDYLSDLKVNSVVLSFADIEGIIGRSLPQSAFEYNAWWANDRTHTQAKNGWMAANWQILDASLGTKVVQFNRKGRTR